ncbi:MAG: M48 family metalloprotease [Verrucomicrobia bacterium]|nr:M48 family metalloprotease [Verrucomicrobiota bacterium]
MKTAESAGHISLHLSRRAFLNLSLAAGGGAVLSGCATNPVTGKSQLMFLTEAGEIQVDQQNAPHQISADYGTVQDPALNAYIDGIGKSMAPRTHRPHMPYSCRAVNAVYLNAYTFPGGTVAASRGLLVDLRNEAELAAIIGHEFGHVNARHGAQRMTKSILTSTAIAALTLYVESEHEDYAWVASGLGGIGAGALLAFYSRDNEREADELGMQYMVADGYSPEGMVGAMDVLRSASDHDPSVIERMFASHPMSEDRYQDAITRMNSDYAQFKGRPNHRDRYMDHTASLRKIAPAIKSFQNGEKSLVRKNLNESYNHLSTGLQQVPNDYAGLLLMSKCCLAMNRASEAQQYAERAKAVYPEEAQAYHMSGMAGLSARRYADAHSNFTRYEALLPGNPNTSFYNGFALEGMGRRQDAANQFASYLQRGAQGELAQYSFQRLTDWGYIQPTQ